MKRCPLADFCKYSRIYSCFDVRPCDYADMIEKQLEKYKKEIKEAYEHTKRNKRSS